MEELKRIFKDEKIRREILVTLFILVIFRIGSNIPVLGIDREYLTEIFESGNTGIFELFNMFSGGAFSSFTIFALGVTPYITSSIIIQLMEVVSPKLKAISKEGEAGRKEIAKFTRWGAVLLALVQAIGYTFGFFRGALIERDFITSSMIVLLLTSGSMLLTWLGERIDEYGIGSGISILIYGSIVSGFPSGVGSIFTRVSTGSMSLSTAIIIAVLIMLVIAGIVYVQEGERKVPVAYGGRVKGTKKYASAKTYIPMKVNQASVLPVIFASSLLQFPFTIMMFFKGSKVYFFYEKWFTLEGTPGLYVYIGMSIVLIMLFSLFYTEIALDTEEISEKLAMNGGVIKGVRPGTATRKYLRNISLKLAFAGGVFLSIVDVLPIIVGEVTGLSLAFGGTSLIIVVGVTLEVIKRLKGKASMTSYKSFLGR